MKLRNNLILLIVEAGGRMITANNLDEKHDYRVIKFRQALAKAFNSLKASEEAIVKECHLKADADGKITGSAADKKKFNKLEEELLKDDTDLGDIKAIPFSAWHELKKENKQLSRAEIEDALEDVFWTKPEE